MSITQRSIQIIIWYLEDGEWWVVIIFYKTFRFPNTFEWVLGVGNVSSYLYTFSTSFIYIYILIYDLTQLSVRIQCSKPDTIVCQNPMFQTWHNYMSEYVYTIKIMALHGVKWYPNTHQVSQFKICRGIQNKRSNYS